MRREYFENQTQDQGDGTYLVRPYGIFGPIYRLDQEARSRYITFVIWYLRISLLAIIGSYFLFLHNFVISLSILVISGVTFCAYERISLGNFTSAPRGAWTKPTIISIGSFYPRWVYLINAILSG